MKQRSHQKKKPSLKQLLRKSLDRATATVESSSNSSTQRLRSFSIHKEEKAMKLNKLFEIARQSGSLDELEKNVVSIFSFKPELAVNSLSSIINEYCAHLDKLSKQKDQKEFKGAFRESVDAKILINTILATVLDSNSIDDLPKGDAKIHKLVPAIIKTLSLYIVIAKIDLDNDEGKALKTRLAELVNRVLIINSKLSETVSKEGFVIAALGIAYLLTGKTPFEINISKTDLDNLKDQKKHNEELTQEFLKLFK